MWKYLRRSLCFLLCTIVVFFCVSTPVGAIKFGSFYELTTSLLQEWFGVDRMAEDLERMYNYFKGTSDDFGYHLAPLTYLDSAVTRSKMERSILAQLAYDWNSICAKEIGFSVDLVDVTMASGEVYTVAMCHGGADRARMGLADGNGSILYCDATTELSGRWSSEDQTSGRHLLDYNALYNLAQDVGGQIRLDLNNNFYEIYKRDGQGMSLYCNVAGRRFSCIYKPDQTAVNQDRPTTGGTIIEGDTITNIENNDNSVTNNDYSQYIDIENMQQALPHGIINNIDNLIYDDNTKTYYVDSHDVTNNITQNFLYEYHINYTSITYIGQTEEYNKRYELYYQLPDGRDSADLTREELEQLNVDIDVIPYVRSTDNVDVRSLYHFDADTRDSSYWNYITEFEWITGASLTYMESGAFNGALYLDENQHAFRMTMPVPLDTAGDWTLQWRYYQSHTEAPVNDSSVYVGDKPVLTMDGSAFYTPAGDQITVIPTGSWNEVCIIRSGGKLYYYVNGVYYAAVDDVHSRFNDIRFIFGSEQQTFKYFDELRFTRGTLYVPGENYTPTSVPHDSNLALILPSGQDVVVDEVVSLTGSDSNLLMQYDRHDWGDPNLVSTLERDYSPYYPVSEYYNAASTPVGPVHTSGYPIVYDRDLVSTSLQTSPFLHRRVVFGGTEFSAVSSGSAYFAQPCNSISLPLFIDHEPIDSYHRSSSLVGDWESDTVYTYSVVLEDGSYSSVTFQIVSCNVNGSAWSSEHGHYCCDTTFYLELLSVVQNSEIQFSFEKFGLLSYGRYEDSNGDADSHYNVIHPVTALCWNSVDGTAFVQHTELVKGSIPEFQVNYETAIYAGSGLSHSPTLAVRTDVTITDYQIGGVRPSVPEKGQVWALVESGYITSLQVYTGSVWINCDGRIWTGERWIPASSYNVITLQDMYDIVDSTQDYEYIYTESGFWSWLQNAWKDMISRLDKIIEGLGGKKGTSLDSCDHVYDLSGEGEASCADHGRLVYTCSLCGDVFTELVDPLGHQWPIDPHSAAILVQPQDVTAPLRSVVKFSVIAVGDGLAYQWQYMVKNGNGWQNSSLGNPNTDTLSVEVVAPRDGYQYRCKITDSNGKTVVSDAAVLTVGDLSQPVYTVPTYSCSRCGITGMVHDGDIISSDGVPSDAFTFDDLLLDSFDGIWTIVTGFVTTGYGGLSGFVESFSLLPGFFNFYRPVSICGGGDIWD